MQIPRAWITFTPYIIRALRGLLCCTNYNKLLSNNPYHLCTLQQPNLECSYRWCLDASNCVYHLLYAKVWKAFDLHAWHKKLSLNTTCTYSNQFLLFQYQVLQVARNYFGCRDLPFVPLENNGGRGSARWVYIVQFWITLCTKLERNASFLILWLVIRQ